MEPRRLPEGTVTFMFTDIEGSTRLLQQLGDGYAPLLRRHNQILRAAISSAGGTEASIEGDAFFAIFESAPAAVRCAVAVQRSLSSEDRPPENAVRVRIGLHTGEGRLDSGEYVGIDVHRAARICAAGHGGQVVLSDATRALADGSLPSGVTLRDLGEHRLKDLGEPLRLHQLVVDGLVADFPPLRSIGKGNLPTSLTSLIGREDEIGEIAQLLEQSRLVTLTGPGGTGKTRLLLEVARRVEGRFPDGAWFVPLDTVTLAELALPEVARVVGVREEPGRAIADSLADGLASRKLLLALDNLEQIVAVGPRIADVLAGAKGCRALCTSREVLHVGGEQEYAVPPLDLEDGVTLFVTRARQIKPAYEPDATERGIIRDICRSLDGLPLAIELAAARIRLFPVAALHVRLRDALGMLTSGASDLPARQRTLRGTIAWSYELLDHIEREFFARIAVFRGGANLAAVEAVVDPENELGRDALSVMTSLVEKSLVRVAEGPEGEPRFVMLETIREFAAERFARNASEPAVRQRHLEFLLDLATRLENQLFLEDPTRAVERLDAEQGNIRSAIEWSLDSGQPAVGLAISGSVWRFWQQRGHLAEGRLLLERLLAAPELSSDPVSLARGLTAYGGVTYWQGDHAATRPAYERALELLLISGDQSAIAMAEYNVGWMRAFARDTEAAAELFERSAARYRAVNDARGELIATEGLALNELIASNFERARDLAETVAADAERLGMRFHHADAYSLLAVIYVVLGDSVSGRRALVSARDGFRAMGDMSRGASLLELGAALAVLEGRAADAARLLGAIAGLRETGEQFFLPSEVNPLPNPEPRARQQLSPEQFQAAFEEGRRWPVEEALGHAVDTESHQPS